jgi:hypothetical protein
MPRKRRETLAPPPFLRQREWIAQDRPGEARPEIEPARYGRDQASVRSANERANPAVRGFGSQLEPPADPARHRFDFSRADSPQNFFEVVGKDALLRGRRRPQPGVADANRRISGVAAGHWDPKYAR